MKEYSQKDKLVSELGYHRGTHSKRENTTRAPAQACPIIIRHSNGLKLLSEFTKVVSPVFKPFLNFLEANQDGALRTSLTLLQSEGGPISLRLVVQETFSHCNRITDKTLLILFPMENVRSEADLLCGIRRPIMYRAYIGPTCRSSGRPT